MASYLLGIHAIQAKLKHHAAQICKILYLDQEKISSRKQAILDRAQAQGIELQACRHGQLDQFSHHSAHQGIIALLHPSKPAAAQITGIEDLESSAHDPILLLILDQVTDPHNLGACLRMADVTKTNAIIVPKNNALQVNATVTKIASGAAETVAVIPVTNLVRAIQQLQQKNIYVFGTCETATQNLFDLEARAFNTGAAWVLGSEGSGIRPLTRKHCDFLIRIPTYGQVSSLNVSMAAALCLYETRRKLNTSPTSQKN